MIFELSAGELSIAEQIESFIRAKRSERKSQNTIKFYTEGLHSFTAWCDTKLLTKFDELTSDLIRDYLLQLQKTHNDGGVHAYFRTLRVFVRWWFDEYEPPFKNPLDKVKAPPLPKDPLNPPETLDILKMANMCERDLLGLRDRAIIMCLLDTGLRAFELEAITEKEIDFSDGSIFIPAGKGNKARTVFFGAKTRKAVKQYQRARGKKIGPLFLSRTDEKLSHSGLRNMLERRARAADVETPTLHGFRRAFTLAQLQAGVDVVTIARLLGHSDASLVWRYAKQSKANLAVKYRSVVDKDS